MPISRSSGSGRSCPFFLHRRPGHEWSLATRRSHGWHVTLTRPPVGHLWPGDPESQASWPGWAPRGREWLYWVPGWGCGHEGRQGCQAQGQDVHQNGRWPLQVTVNIKGEQLRSENFLYAWPYEHIDSFVMLENLIIRILLTFSSCLSIWYSKPKKMSGWISQLFLTQKWLSIRERYVRSLGSGGFLRKCPICHILEGKFSHFWWK